MTIIKPVYIIILEKLPCIRQNRTKTLLTEKIRLMGN